MPRMGKKGYKACTLAPPTPSGLFQEPEPYRALSTVALVQVLQRKMLPGKTGANQTHPPKHRIQGPQKPAPRKPKPRTGQIALP